MYTVCIIICVPYIIYTQSALSTIPEVIKRKYHYFFQFPLKMSVFAGVFEVQGAF